MYTNDHNWNEKDNLTIILAIKFQSFNVIKEQALLLHRKIWFEQIDPINMLCFYLIYFIKLIHLLPVGFKPSFSEIIFVHYYARLNQSIKQ